MSASAIYVGSSCQSNIGVGNLLKWDAEDVDVEHNKDGWTVTEKRTGDVYHCYDLMRLEADLEGAGIEECSLVDEESLPPEEKIRMAIAASTNEEVKR